MKLNQLINESVTFGVNSDDETGQFKDVLSICFFMQRVFFYQCVKKRKFFEKYLIEKNQAHKGVISFEPDGGAAFDKTGTVNIYTAGLINEHFKQDFKECVIETVRELKKHVEVGPMTVEGHFPEQTGEYKKVPRKPHQKGDPVENVGVIRVPIVKNEVEVADIPEMNVSNANARVFLKILGLDDEDLVGRIPHSDIPKFLMRIRNISDDKIQTNSRDRTETSRTYMDKSGETPEIKQGGRMIDMGLPAHQIKGYLDSITKLLKYALDNKLDVVYS